MLCAPDYQPDASTCVFVRKESTSGDVGFLRRRSAGIVADRDAGGARHGVLVDGGAFEEAATQGFLEPDGLLAVNEDNSEHAHVLGTDNVDRRSRVRDAVAV